MNMSYKAWTLGTLVHNVLSNSFVLRAVLSYAPGSGLATGADAAGVAVGVTAVGRASVAAAVVPRRARSGLPSLICHTATTLGKLINCSFDLHCIVLCIWLRIRSVSGPEADTW